MEPRWQLPILHINATQAEIDSSYIPRVEVVGDIADSLTGNFQAGEAPGLPRTRQPKAPGRDPRRLSAAMPMTLASP
jgi:thiamine pyrophosphate-dependent acetolactate synthase large subunit-like protein